MSDSSVKTSTQKSNTSGGNETNSAFADAVQRARQLAAKIHSVGSDSTGVSGGTKRPLEDNMNGVADGAPDVKKVAAGDQYGSQIGAPQHRNGSGPDFVIEEYRVPDKMVGLIIGRGGEQIIRLQTETGCKIQLAPDSGGAVERPCTLSGNRESVEKVKEMIDQIINKANSPFPPEPGHGPGGQYMEEIMVPGPKVGLLIGKGGENIRNLQEKGGVKMVLIQDGPQQTAHDKPLRITGDPQKVEFAKQMVADLLAQKEMDRAFSQANGVGPNQEDIIVPRQAVGVVIGKGGDMIKRIQQDSGARVQFIQGKEDVPGDKLCQISGSMDQVQKALGMIRDLIQSVLVRDQQMGGGSGGMVGGGGRGRGRGRGGGFGGPGMGGPGMRPDFGGPGPRMGRPQDGMNEIQFAVPANKCGLVIGKGGENVRNINQQSGAHVEIAKGAPPNPHEKLFIIRGSPQQIEHAKQLIGERIGGLPPGQSGPPGGPNAQGPPGQFQPQYPQQFQQPAPGQPYAPPGWGNAYQHWQSQPVGAVATNDPAKVAADANAAAWAAYYAQYYNQPGQPQPTQIQPQPQAQPQQPTAGSQPDYSAQWAEYYRSLGMFREAEMIEQQARTNQGQGAQPPQTSVPGGPMTAQPVGAGAPVPQPTQPTAQPAAGAAPTGQAAPPTGGSVNIAAWTPTAYPQQPGQQPPQAQVPYAQPSPYPGYNYAAYGGQQQFPVSAPQ